MAKIISEGLEYQDMLGLVKPTVHIDEFESRMGSDEDVIVCSLFVRDGQAALDLVNFLEKGYDFVLDADRSPGEITPNRFLVYIEMRRLPEFVDQLDIILQDIYNLTDIKPEDYKCKTNNSYFPYSKKNIEDNVLLTSEAYQKNQHDDINALRESAGLAHKNIHKRRPEVRALQDLAHIPRS